MFISISGKKWILYRINVVIAWWNQFLNCRPYQSLWCISVESAKRRRSVQTSLASECYLKVPSTNQVTWPNWLTWVTCPRPVRGRLGFELREWTKEKWDQKKERSKEKQWNFCFSTAQLRLQRQVFLFKLHTKREGKKITWLFPCAPWVQLLSITVASCIY